MEEPMKRQDETRDEGSYRYFAFLSYSAHDTRWGKRLQRKLERYRMPATLCSERGWKRKPLQPVFFAPTDIQPGELSLELQARLQASRHLIVICSPSSAQSEWVGREIAYFHSLGRADRIHFFIVEGTPHSGDVATECFNPVVDQLGMGEVLGANIHEAIYRRPRLNRERAYVQLITKLLDVEFDTLWRRHRRLMIQQTSLWIAAVLVVIGLVGGVWKHSQPVDIGVQLTEQSPHNDYLPPLDEAVVTLLLGEETKQDTLYNITDEAHFVNVPHRLIGQQVTLRVRCRQWLPVDTVVTLSRRLNINLRRNDSVYGHVHFVLEDNHGHGVAHCPIRVGDMALVSDAQGVVDTLVPLPLQRQAYALSATVRLTCDSITMPCGEYDVVPVEAAR